MKSAHPAIIIDFVTDIIIYNKTFKSGYLITIITDMYDLLRYKNEEKVME
jgi:hypothetical protein